MADDLTPNPPFTLLMQEYAADVRSILNVPELGVDVPELGGTIADAQAALGIIQAQAARAYLGSPQDSPAGGYPAWCQIPLDTVDYDQSGEMAEIGPLPALGYVVPATGIYVITASVQITLAGSLQPNWILSIWDQTGELDRGPSTMTFADDPDIVIDGNLGLSHTAIRNLAALTTLYPAVYAPYRFAYETLVGQASNSLAVARIG